MPGVDIQSILNGRVLSGTIQKVTPGLPIIGIPPELVNPTGSMLRQVNGDWANFITARGSRKGIQRAERDAPSVNRSVTAIGEQGIKLLNFKNNLNVKADTLRSLKSDDAQVQKIGEQEWQRQIGDARQQIDNGRIIAVTSALALGTISYDSNGAVLPSTSTAVLTHDLGVPAANKSQIARGTAGANIIDVSWANTSAPIDEQMQNLQNVSLSLSGKRIARAMYGSSIVKLIRKSDFGDQVISANPAFQNAFAGGMIPDGFLGIDKWMPGHAQFWNDDSDTVVRPFGANAITFTPAPNDGWYEMTQGTTEIPRDLGGVNMNPETLLSNSYSAPGRYAYGYMPNPDPVRFQVVYGDCYLPWFTVPEAVFIATVVF